MSFNWRRIFFLLTVIVLLPILVLAADNRDVFSVSLNGEWEIGFARIYTTTANVPGIPVDPSHMNAEKLWYKKEIQLPAGNWQFATLELKGARFAPQVYINGELVSKQNGGMAPTFHLLTNRAIKPGNKITIEIALQSLKDLPPADASFIPPADQWRSNVSSGLWDDVVLHLSGSERIDRIIPFFDYKKSKASIHYNLTSLSSKLSNSFATLQILDKKGKILIIENHLLSSLNDSILFNYFNILKPWSPEEPNLYSLKLSITNSNNTISDEETIPFGIKHFAIKNKQFYLNNEPCKIKGGTVVWHRWMRSKEGRELGFDTAWFRKNIVQRLKEHGANYLRFHLGKPPERLLNLCDKYGLLVQYEWSFFHGMPATKESLLEQYKNWLDMAMRHPCVAIIHPYNETEGEQLKTVWNALDTLLKSYPPLVMEERDVIHVHKYWWSLFENLGLYYDDADQFPKTIMVDEFGGNYLDEKGDLGGYKALKETYLRYLGRAHTKEERLEFHAQSNAKVAEYWRRINAAGFAPFCILSSWEDGNNWFLGKLKEGNPKPVWDELTAAYSPVSMSLNIWDRNFIPEQKITVPVYLFNDTKVKSNLRTRITINDSDNHYFIDTTFIVSVPAFTKKVEEVHLVLPKQVGNYFLKATLLNKPETVKYPVVSVWNIHIFKAKKPEVLQTIKVAVPADEKELKAYLAQQHITTTKASEANVIITSLDTWKKIAAGDNSILNGLEQAIDRGISVIMLDAGERYLGQGYPAKNGDLGPLQGVARVTDPKITSYKLFKGVSLKFAEAAEPESYIHADINDSTLLKNIPKEYMWLWNGLRGGLIAPAADMEFSGLSADAFLTQWKAKGADETSIKKGNYYAYELQGFFEFSSNENDVAAQKMLKDKVTFLVQDAPALANSINPSTPVKITNLSQGYKSSQKGEAQRFISLVNCGKNLTRTPVAFIDFGKGKGKLIVSQLLTSGRLANGFGEKGFYGIRYDEVAVQLVLNMLNKIID